MEALHRRASGMTLHADSRSLNSLPVSAGLSDHPASGMDADRRPPHKGDLETMQPDIPQAVFGEELPNETMRNWKT